MKVIVMMVAALAFFATPPLQSQIIGKLTPAERNAVIEGGETLPNPCKQLPAATALDSIAVGTCSLKYRADSSAHADRFKRAAQAAAEANEEFNRWCKLNEAECRKLYPAKFAAAPAVSAPASTDATLTPTRDTLNVGGVTDSAIVAQHARDSARAAEFVRNRPTRQAARAGAQGLPPVNVRGRELHFPFCKGSQTKESYEAALRANDPSVLNGDCATHVRTWNAAHPTLRLEDCDDLADYISRLETHALPLMATKVSTYWIDGTRFGRFDRKIKESVKGVGEVGLFDPHQMEYVGFMGCCNPLDGEKIPIGIARGASGGGPRADAGRAGATGRRDDRRGRDPYSDPRRYGAKKGGISPLGWAAIGVTTVAAVVGGYCIADEDHCGLKNKNTNTNTTTVNLTLLPGGMGIRLPIR